MTRADLIRSSVDEMRAAVRDFVCGRAWTGPFPEVLEDLAEVAQVDLCLARLVEGHADARRILSEAGTSPQEGVYGVWASRSVGTGVRVARNDERWRLRGEVRFASGIDIVDRVLLPAWLDADRHLLFDVPLDLVEPDRSTWHTAGMDASRSFTVRVDAVVDADPIGGEGFYLGRPGFVVGGLGVAAVWAGGARAVTDLVATGLGAFTPSPHQLRRLGRMDQASWEATTAVRHVAARLDALAEPSVGREVTAARTAAVTACEIVLDEAGRIVGPGGLSGAAALSRILADLQIYIRQHHLDQVWEAGGRSTLNTAERNG